MDTDDTALIDPKALRQTRKERGISQRELGRRVATRLGRAEMGNAMQVRLSRIETGDEISREDRELVDAIAAELAIGADELAEAPLWIWAGVETGRLAIVAMALRVVAFTTPEDAYNARDTFSLATEGKVQPFKNALLMPVASAAVYGQLLDENFSGLGEADRLLLVEIDPDLERLKYLAGIDIILRDDYDFEQAIESLTLATISSYPVVSLELIELHQIALRRVVEPPPRAPAAMLDQWRREEERLFAMIEQEHLRRRRWRESMLPDAHRPQP